MNDLVRLAIERACDRFGGNRIFNAGGFGIELNRLAGLEGVLDGRLARVILAGRADVIVLRGGGHFRLLEVAGE